MTLGTVDIILLVVSIVVSAGIGIYQGVKGIKQTSTDYLLGSRQMKPLPLAMSLTMGTVSAITIMGNAGEVYARGTQIWLMDIGMALGMYFVAKVFIPIFYPMKMISLYHYIECRFQSIWLRRATVLLTLAGAYIFIGFLLYPPSAFLQVITGLSTMVNIAITGLACSLYSSFGGVKAVVYTDVLQAIIMIVGSLTMVIQGAVSVGGLDKAWDIAYHRERIEFFNFDLDPYQRHSFWLVIIYGFFFSLSTYGVSQSQTQRTFSTSSVKEAQKVIYYAIVGMLLLKGLCNLSGITIFANFADCDPLTANPEKQQKDIFIVIIYVMSYLTKIPGLSGLFVASIYAAVLSSVSTQVNSMTALLWEDFLKNLSVFKSLNDIQVARLQKVIVLITGIVGIAMGITVSVFPSSFLSGLLQTVGALWGPMVGLFLVAIYLPWVKWKGATFGFFLGLCISMWLVLGQFLTQPESIFLPMSRDGCPAPVKTTNETITESPALSNNSTEIVNPEILRNHGVGFYGISYCLNYCWGVLACIIVSIIVTIITGANEEHEVEERLISPTSWKIFTTGFNNTIMNNLKSHFRRSNCPINQELEEENKEEMVNLNMNNKN